MLLLLLLLSQRLCQEIRRYLQDVAAAAAATTAAAAAPPLVREVRISFLRQSRKQTRKQGRRLNAEKGDVGKAQRLKEEEVKRDCVVDESIMC